MYQEKRVEKHALYISNNMSSGVSRSISVRYLFHWDINYSSVRVDKNRWVMSIFDLTNLCQLRSPYVWNQKSYMLGLFPLQRYGIVM